jgi:hypothetical protein
MPMRYQRNDARRRMVVTVQSTIDPDDTPAVIELQPPRRRLELWITAEQNG